MSFNAVNFYHIVGETTDRVVVCPNHNYASCASGLVTASSADICMDDSVLNNADYSIS
jgi:hypothetical protein